MRSHILTGKNQRTKHNKTISVSDSSKRDTREDTLRQQRENTFEKKTPQ